MKEILFKILRRIFWIICKIIPVDSNKIAVVSYYGRGYSDNPKYIVEEILREKNNYKIIWFVEDTNNKSLPDNVKLVKLGSFKYIYEMSTSKFWIDNCRKWYCMKKKNQYYIQTWHGGFGLKKIEKDAIGKLEPCYVKMAIRDSKQADLLVSNSKTLTKLYYESFWYNGQVLECGLPRNDALFNVCKNDVYIIKNKLKIPNNKKILLYAPTFRQNKSLDAYNMDYTRCVKSLNKRFGGEWIILLRLHPNVFKLSSSINFDSNIMFDVSKYEDIQELYIISDMAVTDYSSIMFDFTITGKPCLLYASDIFEYKSERDFFITLDSLPYPLAQTNDELSKIIYNFNIESYNEKVEKFNELHGFCDSGKASKAVVQWIKNKN